MVKQHIVEQYQHMVKQYQHMVKQYQHMVTTRYDGILYFKCNQ